MGAGSLERMANFLGLTKCGDTYASGPKMLQYDKRNFLLTYTGTKKEALKLSAQFRFEFE